MRHLTLVLSFLVYGIGGHAQYFPVGVRTLTYTDATRSNRSVGIEVHYPGVTAGTNTTLANDSFPFVIFGHGFQMTGSAYYPFADSLAQRGYIVVLTNTETGLSPSHPNFAQDFIFLYNTLISESANAASPFYHHVTSRGAIGGHSMGGGCTILSAQYGNPAACYFTFAEATTNPSSIIAASSMTKPYLSFAGSYDCIAPYGTNQQPTYDSSHSPCKVMVNITGASHCQFGLGNFQCNLGEGVSGCANPPLSRIAQINTVLGYLQPYLDYYLKGICRAWTSFDSVYSADAVNTKTRNCTNVVPSSASISGPTSFCAGSSATLTALPGGFQYAWSSGQTTGSIAVSTTGTYAVTVGNGTCSIRSNAVTETVLNPPAAPSAISGLDSVCINSDSILYSVPAVPGATSYNWTVPSGWVINSGAGSNTVIISPDTSSGAVSVSVTTACGTSANTSLAVGFNTAPHISGTISGADTVCVNGPDQVYNFSGSADGALYWTVSSPYLIVSGQSTNALHLSNVSAAGTLTLISSGSCGQSLPLTLNIAIADTPQISGTISGADTICTGHPDQSYAFAGTHVGSLSWAVSAPYSITSGQSTNAITTSGASANGTITLLASNNCGQTIPLTYQVAVIDTPHPTVIQSHDSLRSSVPGTSYQWYLNGQAISSANSQSYVPVADGNYTVVVTNANGCEGSAPTYNYIGVWIGDIASQQISVYPNPATNLIYIRADHFIRAVQVTDGLGKVMISESKVTDGLDISNIAVGIYFMQVITDDDHSSFFRISKR